MYLGFWGIIFLKVGAQDVKDDPVDQVFLRLSVFQAFLNLAEAGHDAHQLLQVHRSRCILGGFLCVLLVVVEDRFEELEGELGEVPYDLERLYPCEKEDCQGTELFKNFNYRLS